MAGCECAGDRYPQGPGRLYRNSSQVSEAVQAFAFGHVNEWSKAGVLADTKSELSFRDEETRQEREVQMQKDKLNEAAWSILDQANGKGRKRRKQKLTERQRAVENFNRRLARAK